MFVDYRISTFKRVHFMYSSVCLYSLRIVRMVVSNTGRRERNDLTCQSFKIEYFKANFPLVVMETNILFE